jgi:hypothetical protein
MNDRQKNILNQVNNLMKNNELKLEIQNLIDTFSMVVQLNKAMYDEMIKQGFNEQQAFKFSCDYVLGLVTANRNNG